MDGPRCVRVSYRPQTRSDSAAVIGPIVGGYVSQTKLGWRFPFWIMFIVSALNALACIFITPETVGDCYFPPLLHQWQLNILSSSVRYSFVVERRGWLKKAAAK